jgi:DNA-nicking Smr family endonuclease
VEARLPDPNAEDREVTAELESLVRGEMAFDLSDTDEFLEGAVADLDRRTRRQLRHGEFAVQAHLDLHGLSRDEARDALAGFIGKQRGLGRRCVLIIHGRGLNSKDQIPVLKESMARWLSRGALGRQVLGFCTARPSDGGAGALYVLLRR